MLKHDDKPYITTVSGHEVALSAQHLKNYPQAAIIFNGTGKKLSEIETALTCSTAVYLNIDSKFDYDRIKTVYQKLQGASLDHNHNKQPKLCLANKKLLIRYNPNIETLNVLHPYVATAIENSKFGVADQEVEEILRQAQNDGIEISGFHMHLGSTIDQVDIYHQAIASIQKMLNKFEQQGLVKLDNLILNLGGGLGLDYQMFLGNSEHQTQKSCTVEDLVSSTIENDFLALANHHNFEIIFEPGRSLVANVSILVSKILGVKQNFNGTKNFIITDISMNECIRPSLYGSYHHIGLVEADNGAHEQTYDIVGPVCESGDFIGKNRKLPVPEGNSYVILHDVGAYSGCMASNYNLRLRPVEVLVQPDGELQIIAQKESMTSLLSRFKI